MSKNMMNNVSMMSRKLSDEKIKSMQQAESNKRGPSSRYGGIKEKPKDLKKTIKQLLSYVSKDNKSIIYLVIIVVISTLLNLSVNILLEKIIASLGVYDFESLAWTKAPDINNFIKFIIILICVYLTHCFLQYFSGWIGTKLGINTGKKMRNELINIIIKLPIKYTDSHPHGDLMSRVTNDVDNITNAVSQTLASLISGVITLVGCVCIMLYYSPLLTLVSFITLILSFTFTMLMSKFMRPLFLKQQGVLGLLNSQTEEMVSGCKTVIAYNHQTVAENEFNCLSEDLKHIAIKANIWGGSMGPIMNFVGNVGYFLVCFFGAIFVTKGIGNGLFGNILTTSVVITFLTLNKQFTRPINELAQLYSTMLTALAGAERVFTLLEEETESFEGKISFSSDKMIGNIDFNHIGFSYVEDKPVLKDFNVDVKSGHKIALVGATGSGKTTIVNLLLRFYDINKGKITIDGIDIADMSKKDLRDAISIVLQDAVLFSDTVENNIKYGKENATEEEFNNALEMAHCTSFVNRLPDKEKTMLSEGATNISQGQRQLLTIARAILANPKILILDEATSSVDTRTEKKIQDALVNLMKNRTSIIIAHRLSTIQDADLIVVLDQGVVVEMGNHKELIDKDGVYNRLYQTQFQGLSI